MAMSPTELARQRVTDLADDPRYRPYVIGYLLSCLPERHWDALVQSALEFGEYMAHQRELDKERAAELQKHGG